MELECGYSPQDQTIAILSFSAPLNQHWPRPRPLLENQPWEEHYSETLLRSSPILQTPADYKLLHIHTHTHIYKDMQLPPHPRSLASIALNRQPDKRVCDQRWDRLQDRMAACRSWITSPVASRVSMVYYVLLLLRCFSCSHTVFPRSIVWGLFFFLLPFLMLCCIFLQKSLHFTTDYTLYDCVCDK